MTKAKDHAELLSQPIRVAVLGSGGREHALVKKIASSTLCESVLVIPGNDGMLSDAAVHVRHKMRLTPLDGQNIEGLVKILHEEKISLVVVGPDDWLAAGVTDRLTKEGFAVFGPTQKAAKLEWSKAFAKDVMEAANVPTAKHVLLEGTNSERLEQAVATLGGYPIVLKYDGLALGKGVRICVDEHDAANFFREVFEDQKFERKGNADTTKGAPRIVAEQFLQGHEVSLFAITDGTHFSLLEPACDYKRLGEGNTGPNTGGMGAYSPVPWLPPQKLVEIAARVFPTAIAEMKNRGTPFSGLLYAGLMVSNREYWVLEFNARFGDPETQAILPRLQSDLLPLLYGAAVGALKRNLDAHPLRWTEQACVNIVAASPGYPEKPTLELPLAGRLEPGDGEVYFAGVRKVNRESQTASLISSGGRVFSVSCLAETLEDARVKTIGALGKFGFEGMVFRRDVGRVRPGF